MIFNYLALSALCMLKIDLLYSCPEQTYRIRVRPGKYYCTDESQKNICAQRAYCYETSKNVFHK